MNALSKATEHHIMINNRPLNDYFCGSDGCSRHLNEVLQPLKLVDGEYFNIKANVNGVVFMVRVVLYYWHLLKRWLSTIQN